MERWRRYLDQRTVLAGSMLLTFVVTRVCLHLEPDTDLTIGPYNIHHLFTGVLIVAACGIPAVLYDQARFRLVALAGFGVGLSLVLDEWLYLIVTDGSNAAYVQAPSLIGGALLVGAACAYAWLLPRGREG